jgi:hypothetical protein
MLQFKQMTPIFELPRLALISIPNANRAHSEPPQRGLRFLGSFFFLLVAPLVSCSNVNLATTARTATLSGKMTGITDFYAGASHVFIHSIDGKRVTSPRTFTVDAGHHSVEVNSTTFKLEIGYKLGTASLSADLVEGHTYQCIGGIGPEKTKIHLRDVTGADERIVVSVPIRYK